MTDIRQAEEALRLAQIIELADGARRTGHSLGFSLINYGRLFVRDYWTLFSIARELDCTISDLSAERDERDEKRAKWDVLTRASEEILSIVRTLPGPLRFVAEARARGESWRKIQRSRPDRLLFSMQEDFGLVLEILERRAKESVLYLVSAENFIVVKRLERA